MTRKEQAKITKNKILDCSLELLRNNSFQMIKVSEICKKSNVTTGAFYHYFKSKNDILYELYRRVDKSFEKEYSNLSETTNLGRLKEYLNKYSSFAEHCGLDSVTNIYYGQLDDDTCFFTDENRVFFRILKELILKAEKSNELNTKLTVDEIITDVMIIEQGAIFTWCITRGEVDVKALSKTLLDDYLQYIMEENKC
ncbi:MAG: TetR/AcrR family transcriptional regulator [Anaerostipes sp.]|jgi:TetR/AcrR family fatty acid metabolism transcriptional regulator|nr:TetR/AcrR family transcriptional regulator [Anaerostipes sp.]MDD3745385.1 TetR/AcrR family transcriptional regulator [Anaerostipes sp.]